MKFVNVVVLLSLMLGLIISFKKEFQFYCTEDCLPLFKDFLFHQHYLASSDTEFDSLYPNAGYVGVCTKEFNKIQRKCIINYYYGTNKEVNFLKFIQYKRKNNLILLLYSKKNPSIEFIDTISSLKSSKIKVFFLFGNEEPTKSEQFQSIEYLFNKNRETGRLFFEQSILKNNEEIFSKLTKFKEIINSITKDKALNNIELKQLYIEGRIVKDKLLFPISKFYHELLHNKEKLNKYLWNISHRELNVKNIRRIKTITLYCEQITLPNPKELNIPNNILNILHNII